jgi:GAF domain-containing protein
MVYVGRSQASQHLTAALDTLRRLVSGDSEEKLLATMLDTLMITLRITDEGTIYRYDPQHGVLWHQLSLGLRPWSRGSRSSRLMRAWRPRRYARKGQ